MNNILKLSLFVSLLLNGLFLILVIVFVIRKGGLSYFLHKSYSFMKIRNTSIYDTDFYRDKKTHFETLPKSEAEVILLGDSLTDLCEWAELFRNNRIKNRGICADTTEGVLNRLDNIIESKPQKLFIMIGINDLNQGRPVEDILSNYKQILKVTQEQIPITKVFIQSNLPVNNQKFPNNGINEKVIIMNTTLKDFAKEFSFEYIDLFSSFLDSKGQLDAKYTSDGVHLNGQGYLIWKEIIEKYVVN